MPLSIVDIMNFTNYFSVLSLIDGLYKKFGKENVSYNSKGDYYLINSKMKACAISSNGKDWKFLILEESYKNKLNNILPKKILHKF